MTSCADAVGRLWAYLEGGLSDADRDRVEAHLAGCPRCGGELRIATALHDLDRSAGDPRLPADVERRLLTFLRQLERTPG